MKLTWKQYHADILALADKISEYNPDVIVPCMIGGLIPGAIIAKHLGISDVRPIDIERRGSERHLVYDVQGELRGKRVVIVEDDLPTGIGPKMVKELFERRGAEVKIAAIYVTPQSQEIVDYYVEMPEQPYDYPWKERHIGDRVRK